jgi:hypothetical protein
MANFSDKYLGPYREWDRIRDRVPGFWRDRFRDMLLHAARAETLLPGCTMPLPVKCRVTRLPKSWPLAVATVELEDGRRFHLGMNKKSFTVQPA